MIDTLEILKQEEGFSGTVYVDTEGYDTIGYGTKMPLNKEEAELLLKNRFGKLKVEVDSKLKHLVIDEDAWQILYLMAYQIGVGGLLKFKNMIKALENQNYEVAGSEMLDSRWAKQTPARAKRMAAIMKEL